MKGPVATIQAVMIFLTGTAMYFVPETRLPLWVWPLLLGLANLALLLSRSIRSRTLTDEELVPLMISIFCLTLAAAIPLEHPRRGTAFLAAFGAMVVGGLFWSVWRAFAKS